MLAILGNEALRSAERSSGLFPPPLLPQDDAQGASEQHPIDLPNRRPPAAGFPPLAVVLSRLYAYLCCSQAETRWSENSMADAKTKKGLISHGVAAQNRKARFNYAIKDTLEAGLVLKGPEVKSLRNGRATLSEAWAGERDGEMWLFNAYIPEYQGGVLSRFEPRAPRKLLLSRKQIRTLAGAVSREGVTLVPLQIHFNERGRAKVLLGLGEGRKKQDKRAAIAERDWQRDKARLIRARG